MKEKDKTIQLAKFIDFDKFKGSLIDQFVNDGKNISKWALIIGGVAFAGYLVSDLLKTNKNKKSLVIANGKALVKKEKVASNWLINSIKGYIMAFVLTIAREKIMEALETLKVEDESTK